MSSQVVAAEDIDLEFLPIIYQYLRCLEKEGVEEQRVSQESSQKVLELQKKIQHAREQVCRLPGVDYSSEEQLRRLDALRKQLHLKKRLILKYKSKVEGQH